ncbi:MAG: YggS family pyridoxal phosphate-dependent enzyme [Clostridia bacterium]|nr:YggS family pyridoxal phosphate-dependent enzyme [Clostridia bacterium]
MSEFEYIDRNLKRIKEEALQAAKISPYGQDFDILLATKYASAEEINHAYSLGFSKIGENRVQSLLEKYDKLDKGLDIHFIGSLQRNKVKYIIDKVSMIESLDSLELAKEIEKQAAKHDKIMDCLVEVNIGDEESKGGISKNEVLSFIDSLSEFSHIKVCGLMTMAPKCTEIDEYRKYFKESYNIFIDICEKKLHNVSRQVLSMGMSDSFVPALMEGANLIRVGRAAFNKE